MKKDIPNRQGTEYAFIGGGGRPMTKERHEQGTSRYKGKEGSAYAFFYCNADYKQVARKLPDIKERTKSPSDLELSLTEVEKIEEVDEQLQPVLDEARGAKMNYMLKASMPNIGNKRVADELDAIMINVYASQLYAKGEPLNAGIVYQRGERYVFKRQ